MGNQVNMHPPSSMDSLFASMLGGMSAQVVETLGQLLQSQITKEVQEIKSHLVEKPVSVKEAALFLGVHFDTVYDWCESGTIPQKYVHRVGTKYFFFPSELQEFLKSR